MGEVYRARDQRLNRDVALKVLPDSVASDPERLARFRREAQILAAVGHPNIANIYGFEEADGTRALVLELVEGPTLAELIDARRLPYDEALGIARQIAEALEAAHELGIVHRDLKPANIKVRPDGMVKVLDFGLAKAQPAGAASGDDSDSPTITRQSPTGEGVILGTAAYMSPEQAKGKEVDRRADIWAFGCVLYEMLTGVRAFQGDSVTDTLAAVVRAHPDWRRLPSRVAPSIRRLLVRCLEKDPRRRLRDIGEARLALESAIAGTPDAGLIPDERRSPSWRVAAAAVAASIVTLLAVGGAVWRARAVSSGPVRLAIVPPSDARLSGASVAISPDGRNVVYVSGNGTQLSVRSLDDLTPRHLTNVGAPGYPFVSPNGQSIGFFDGLNSLKVVPITGGPAVTLCMLRGAAGRGGSWAPDGTIVFATDDPATGLWRVPERGGAPPRMITTPERGDGDHHWPQVLPGGRAALVTTRGRPPEGPELAVVDLATGTVKRLLPGRGGRYVPTGHLVYGAEGELRAIRFDLERLETRGTSVSLLRSVAGTGASPASGGALGVAVADNGTIAYVPGGVTLRRLVWVDRQGREEEIAAPPKDYVIPRVSPDGSRVALDARGPEVVDIWIWDLRRQTIHRAAFGLAVYPVWSPDGRMIAHTTFEDQVGHLFLRATDGTARSERLTEGTHSRYASSFTPDGTRLLFREEAGDTGLDIGIVTLGPPRRVEALIRTPANELSPEVSPDGRWLAYESNPSGQNEVYVRPFPEVEAGLWQVSNGGGRQPAWSRDGRELFFRAPDGSLMAVSVDVEPRFAVGLPRKVLDRTHDVGGPYRTYDVSGDGKRFLMLKAAADTPEAAQIVVVQNWFEDLKRLVP